MQLTEKQEKGLKIAVERFLNHERYTIISGYAGTGKSTLVKFIIAALGKYGIDPDKDVIFTSYTGKATQVLQKKGNKNVSTLHRLLYEFLPRSNGTFYRKRVDDISYKIVVVDECSMVPKELLQELFRHNVYILCLGDPGQLPPINKEDDNHLLDNPHIFLDEVMRQAEESEIIQLSMKIRNGESIHKYKGKEIQIIDKDDLNTGMLMWADQILCATNQKRVALNNQIRDLLGRGDIPEDGDKIICLRNYWDDISDKENPLVNGTVGFIRNSFESFFQLPYQIKLQNSPSKYPVLISNFETDSVDVYSELAMDKKMILEGEPTLDWKDTFKIGQYKYGAYKGLIPMNFTYGYAITGHKSQGSEWNKVLVIEEEFPFDKEEHRRWLYTCVTRAAEKLVLVKA